jgi:Ca2+-binding EF-hand superfamily protein
MRLPPAVLLGAALAALAPPAPAGEEKDLTAILARRIGEAFGAFDANGDGRLAGDELPLEDLFALLDADGDGFVSRAEAEQAAKAAAEAAPAPPAGKKGPGKDAPGKDAPAKDAPAKQGPAKGADAMDPGAFAEAARKRVAVDPRFNPETRRAEFLRNFDRAPEDGKVQRKEYAGGEGDRVFRDFDRDRDGALDGRELLALMKDQVADLAKARRRPTRGEFLLLFDLDDDRNVSREEYVFLRGPAAAFVALDGDGDGVVTYDETIYDRASRDRRYRGRGGDRPGAPAPEARSLWDLYDRDGDGRVTPEEFGGGEAVFRRLDRNRDGYLTLADS